MLNYIATEYTSEIIQRICKKQNILILYETKDITNINTYLKETKVNFNLIKYFIIEVSCLENSEDEIIENIYNFSRLHSKIRIIILAQGFSNQSNFLNQLYDKEIYNIINAIDKSEIEQQLMKCLLDQGIQKTEAKRFEKIKEIKQKESRFIKIKQKIENTAKEKKKANEIIETPKENTGIHQSRGVYFFALLLETITRFVKLICYVAVFLLTSIGITILLNSQLRDMVFEILGLKGKLNGML